jgi:hypothetical protein
MPGFGQGLIAAAACFILKQADAPPEAAAAMAGPAVAGQIPVDPVSLLSVSSLCWVDLCALGPAVGGSQKQVLAGTPAKMFI